VPLAAALAVLVFVLATTPPGFAAIPDVLLGTARGITADASAYAVGAAASLALVALLGVALLCAGLDIALQRRRHNVNTRHEIATGKPKKV
jgi:hypothetical protein